MGLEVELIADRLGADFFLEDRRGRGLRLALLWWAPRPSEVHFVFVLIVSILQEVPAKSGGRQILSQIQCFLITIVLHPLDEFWAHHRR